MAATFAQMIQSAFPDAQTGKDFTFRSDAEGHPEIDYWNSEKLGPEPNLTSLHAEYMKRIRKRKEIMPNVDDGDPAPWLNADYQKTKTPEDPPRTKIRFLRVHDAGSGEVPTVRIDPDTGMICNSTHD
jgi:hypothetical protein